MYCFNCENEIDEFAIVDGICPLCDSSELAFIDDIEIVKISDEFELEEDV